MQSISKFQNHDEKSSPTYAKHVKSLTNLIQVLFVFSVLGYENFKKLAYHNIDGKKFAKSARKIDHSKVE